MCELALAKLLYFEDIFDNEHGCARSTSLRRSRSTSAHAATLPARTAMWNASPRARRRWAARRSRRCSRLRRERGIDTVDITGGAPDAPALRVVPRAGLPHGRARHGPFEPGHPRRPCLRPARRPSTAELGVEVVASLPNVLAAQADAPARQRDVRSRPLAVMRKLNARGYGRDGAHMLDVAFNPQWPVLPPPTRASWRSCTGGAWEGWGCPSTIFSRWRTTPSAATGREPHRCRCL